MKLARDEAKTERELEFPDWEEIDEAARLQISPCRRRAREKAYEDDLFKTLTSTNAVEARNSACKKCRRMPDRPFTGNGCLTAELEQQQNVPKNGAAVERQQLVAA